MPSLFRFLFVVGVLVAIVYGGLWALATYFEPVPKEVRKSVPGIQINR